MRRSTRETLVDRLAEHGRVVEVGVGRRPEVASALADAGVAVTATDIEPRAVPPTVEFVVDDVTDPVLAYYADVDAIYACNLPPDLHHSALALARKVGADLLFTTLGADPTTIDVERETIPGDTLFVARTDDERPAGGGGNGRP